MGERSTTSGGPPGEQHSGWRLAAWWALVGAMIVLAFSSAAAAEDEETTDLVYRYEFGASSIVAYGLVLALVLLIARGLNWRQIFALRPPDSWRSAAALMAGTVVAVFAAAVVLEWIFGAGEEQGLDPTGWQPDRAGALALSALAVAVVAPIAEELTFRGLGVSLLSHLGSWVAIAVTGLAFALAHGIVEGIPVFFVIGAALAYLRVRTGSILPAILVHAVFNGVQLGIGVSG